MSSATDTDDLQQNELIAELQKKTGGDEKIAPEQASGSEIIELEGDLGLVQIEALYTQLAGALEGAGEIAIDATDLKQIDTAAVQLLFAFVKETTSRGLVFSWKGSSDTLCSAADQLGLKELMGL